MAPFFWFGFCSGDCFALGFGLWVSRYPVDCFGQVSAGGQHGGQRSAIHIRFASSTLRHIGRLGYWATGSLGIASLAPLILSSKLERF